VRTTTQIFLIIVYIWWLVNMGGSCITCKMGQTSPNYAGVGSNAHLEELVLWSLRKYMKEYILNPDLKNSKQHLIS